mgnify:CR=1 FL=1
MVKLYVDQVVKLMSHYGPRNLITELCFPDTARQQHANNRLFTEKKT